MIDQKSSANKFIGQKIFGEMDITLPFFLLTEICTEARHKIGGCDQIDRRRQRLQRQLETSSNLFFADFAHRTNFLERTRHTLLATGNVQARRRLGIVRTTLQILAVVHLFEQIIGPVHNCFGQIDAIGHR